MNTIISVINGWYVASKQAVIEKRYPATDEVIAQIPNSKLAILDKALWHTLKNYVELRAEYV